MPASNDTSRATAEPLRIACVFGTRPEAIKMAPVVSALHATGRATPILVNTGQHRELLAETLALFELRPDVDLDLMREAQGLADFASRCLADVDRTLATLAPDGVVAQGDTSTVMMAALASFYRRIPFFHVEAGLRTHDLGNPFPEELNRVVASRVATLHFAPTPGARDNLVREGIAESTIEVTGNTVIDALLMVRERRIPHGVALPEGKRLIVVTSHRRESFGEPIRNTLCALRDIAEQRADVVIVYPAHPNPEVRRAIAAELGDDARVRDNIRVIDPLSYGPFVSLLDAATIVLTDSGGIQEEAPALGKPVLVLREDTERPEAVAAGVARIVGTDRARIVAETLALLDDPARYAAMARGGSPYGDGRAGLRVAERMVLHLGAARLDQH